MVIDYGYPSVEEQRSYIASSFDREFYTPDDCSNLGTFKQLPEKHAEAIRETNEWIRSFITKQVDKQGRREAICPFVEPSLQKKAMFYSIAKPDEPSEIESIDRELRHFAEIFHTMEPKDLPAVFVKSVVAIFPETRGPLLLETTDHTRDVKGDLLEMGILVGEFFSTCPFSSSFNPKLFALRSPRPMYVLRSFIDTDWRFIAQVDRWREIYRERFGEPPAGLAHIGTFRGRVIEKLRSIAIRSGIRWTRKRR